MVDKSCDLNVFLMRSIVVSSYVYMCKILQSDKKLKLLAIPTSLF